MGLTSDENGHAAPAAELDIDAFNFTADLPSKRRPAAKSMGKPSKRKPQSRRKGRVDSEDEDDNVEEEDDEEAMDEEKEEEENFVGPILAPVSRRAAGDRKRTQRPSVRISNKKMPQFVSDEDGETNEMVDESDLSDGIENDDDDELMIPSQRRLSGKLGRMKLDSPTATRKTRTVAPVSTPLKKRGGRK